MNKSSFRYAVLAVICFAVAGIALIATGEGYIGSEMSRKFFFSSGIIGLCAMLMSMKKSRMMVE